MAKVLLKDLDRALASATPDKYTAIMRGVTDLFLSTPTRLTPEQISLFDDVITRLMDRLEAQALAELSTRLTESSNAPDQAIRRLASNNSIAVAGPVLAQSSCLQDEHLVEIAETKSQAHLNKIAGRKHLSPMVTDVLVDRGDHDLIRKIAANSGASFSKLGMSVLAMRADGDDGLIETISKRTDVPSLVFAQLLSYATEQTRTRLLAAQPQNTAIVELVLSQAANQAKHLATIAKDWAAAQRLIESFSQDTELTKRKVVEFADAEKLTELIAALSVLSGVPVDLVGRLVCNQNGFGVMVLCKSINLDWLATHAVLANGPNNAARWQQFETLQDDFDRISVLTARRLLGFWRGRMKAQAAFDRALIGGAQ